MKIYTNSNNTSTLKLLIAANLAGKRVELVDASFEDDVFAGPRALPFLEVDDNLSFFASNAAVQYLFPILDLSENGQCQQMLEWEATRLHPAVSTVLSSKSVASDLKQTLQVLLITLNGTLLKHQYVLGDKLSAVDISLWSTLYPVYDNYDLKQTYMAGCDSIIRWIEELGSAKAIQDAVIEWGGSITGPFGATSVLGIPQVGSLATPVCSPSEEQPEVGPTAEEIVAAKENWENGLENLQAPLKQEKLVLPVKGRKNILITSSLPYVNNVPHLGNIIGCVLSADIFARYCRLCDYNTLYICGTDEYGTATETKALEEGVTPREICDKYFEQHNSVYRWFNIGFDYFGRTSTPQQTKIAQEMFLKLRNNGFVTSQSVDQLFCENCQKFLADRFVEGTCPHPGCGYDGARGDQCDKCGKLINATELLLPRCKTCSNTPVVRPSEQLFIELGLLEPAIRAWVNKVDMHWSPSARAVTRAWLKEHLRPRAVTRDLKWGVPVPLEGYQNKVFYVWFDAPIGYMSITENATKQYETWWKHDKEYDVTLYQFMAKDNVPFHAIMFPATLLGINEGHVIVSRIFATEYLNYEDGKFSKSRGVGVFGNDAQETGIPADVWRFYLASVRPETSDSSFSWTELGTRNNSELLNNLGNFCHRSLSFCANTFKGKVPDLVLTQADYELIALVNREVIAYVQHLEKGRLREALRHVMSVSRLGNQHMQAEQPWVLLKGSDDDKQRGATAIGLCCQLVALLCTLLSPYMPDTTRKLREQLKIDATNLRINPLNPSLIQYLPSGHVIGKPEPLFAKIEADVLDKLRAKYAGSQSDRTDRENKQNGVAEAPVSGGNVAELEAAIAEQGNKVRELKSSTKDKSVWQPEVNKLLDLKKQLAAVQAGAKDASNQNANANLTPAAAAPAPGDTAEQLEKAIAEQGDKVRKLKASTNDKSAWQAELILLLDLKKRLAALNGEVMAPAPEVVAAEAHAAAAAAEGRSDEKVNARPIPPLVAPIPVRPALMPANAAFMPAPAALMPAPAALMPAPAALMPAHAARMLAPAAPMFDPAAPMLAPAAPMFAPAARMLAPAAPMFAPAARMLAPAAPMFDPAAPMFDPAAHMLAPAAHMFAPVAPMPAPAAPMLAPAAPMPDPAPPMQAPAPILLAPVPAVFNADVPIPVVQTMSHLKKAITKQGNKLRKMKESTKDKWVWQAQLILLLDLEERLATLQLN